VHSRGSAQVTVLHDGDAMGALADGHHSRRNRRSHYARHSPVNTVVIFLPCRDSDAMAEACRRELDLPRDLARELGHSAVRAIHAGRYQRANGVEVDWRDAVAAAVEAKISLPPDATLPIENRKPFTETRVQVVNETTLQAAQAMVAAGHRPLALNFANGVSPGGGFLNGARAQEEALCRSSALFATLDGDPMYAAHRQRSRPDSSDWTILSPGVPVFRTDRGQALDRPWPLCFITAAAPTSRRSCRAFGFADALLQDDAERRDDVANENTDQGAES
jgi:uncharacterized protein (TIGR02452 family)